MPPAPDQELRRRRLAALAKHEEFGSRAALGRALGYKDGAFVRQMIDGERPITEKTVAAIEAMRGGKFRGWFGYQQGSSINLSVAEPPPPPADFQDRHWVSDSDWATLQAVKLFVSEVDLADMRQRAKILEDRVGRKLYDVANGGPSVKGGK